MTFLGGGRACMYVSPILAMARWCSLYYFTRGFKFSQLEMSTSPYIYSEYTLFIAHPSTEVALAILLSSFRFRSSEREKTKIFWNRASVAWPSVGPYGNKPSLPLVVEPISH